MKDRNLINSCSERIRKRAGGANKRSIQRISYVTAFVVVFSLVASSYVTADPSTQISLPGVAASDDVNVNPLQGSKSEQGNTARAVAIATATSKPAPTTNGSANPSGPLGQGESQAGNSAGANNQTVTVSEVKAVNVASSIASVVGLSSSGSVSSGAESANVSAELAQADTTSASKQQIVEPTVESKAVTTYTTKEGDTADTIAAKFGISAQTVRWANGLKDEKVDPGKTINIPAVDGVVYTTKEGDNLQSIADKYKTSVDSIIDINNLKAGENAPTGTQLLLPDGILPEEDRPEYVRPVEAPTVIAATTTARSSSSSASTVVKTSVPLGSGNRYAYGYCTWYVYNRRAQMGLPTGSLWGNANTWDSGAVAAGFLVDRTPAAGAIFQTDSGPYGHVGVVEEVYPNGSIRVSEMNYSGWNVISTRVISDPGSYKYIH